MNARNASCIFSDGAFGPATCNRPCSTRNGSTLHCRTTCSGNARAILQCAAVAEGAKIFQLYIRGDKPWIREVLQRARAAGFVALGLQRGDTTGNYLDRRDTRRRQRITKPVVARESAAKTAGGGNEAGL